VNDDEVHASAFARWFDERAGARTAPWRWGSLTTHPVHPGSSDFNFVRLDARSGADPDAVAAGVARLRDEGHEAARRVVVDDAGLADRVTPAFVRAGWRAERYTLMVHRRSPREIGSLLPAVEVALDAYLAFRASLHHETSVEREVAEMVDRAIGTRCFLASMRGEPAGGCVCWRNGADAQLHSVETSPSARGHGVATSVVLAAIDAARVAGATWIHLYTRTDTGPIPFYERLGFDVVGSVTGSALGANR
jgi:GNAT superfamily N-acetyltransferase